MYNSNNNNFTIPINILLEPIDLTKGWQVIYNGIKLIVKKGNYYYDLENVLYLKKDVQVHQNFQLDETKLIYLGNYRPLHLDLNCFSLLPISFNGNEFIVNTNSNIVYIKPKNLGMILAQYSTFSYEIFKDWYYAGMYHPFLHAFHHSNQLFINIIPKNNNKTVLVPNEIHKQYSNPIGYYEQKEKSKTLLGMNILVQNPYVVMDQPQKFDLSSMSNVSQLTPKLPQITTFIIPFLDKHTNNIKSLEKAITSLLYIQNKLIFVVTNREFLELNENIMGSITIINYPKYVGCLGFENRLNIIMKNGYDLCTFYNLIISTYVKTSSFMIWNYNWILETWNPENTEINLGVRVQVHYEHNGNLFSSQKYEIGYLLKEKSRYINSADLLNIQVPNIKGLSSNIIIRSIYNELDYEEIKTKIASEIPNNEFKQVYNSIINGIIPNTLIKLEGTIE